MSPGGWGAPAGPAKARGAVGKVLAPAAMTPTVTAPVERAAHAPAREAAAPGVSVSSVVHSSNSNKHHAISIAETNNNVGNTRALRSGTSNSHSRDSDDAAAARSLRAGSERRASNKTAAGLKPATLAISLSPDVAHLPLAVAARASEANLMMYASP